MPKDFQFCTICRLNHRQGRQHVYGKWHQQLLVDKLAIFLRKITEVRYFIGNVSIPEANDASTNSTWCVFCEDDVSEDGGSFAWLAFPLRVNH